MRIDTEWLDAPGVRDPLLARTWCRLSVSAGDRVVTRFHSERSESVRDGVFGSAWPLCRWIVSQWWSLLFEGAPREGLVRGARANWSQAHSRGWLERHGALLNRDGFALPDLLAFRDEDCLHIAWTEDPEPAPCPARGRFVASGFARVPIDQARRDLAAFVDRVLARVEDLDSAEARDLQSDWQATLSAAPGDRVVMELAGAVGLDPLAVDDEGWSEWSDLAAMLAKLPQNAQADLRDATTVATVAEDVAIAEAAIGHVGSDFVPNAALRFDVATAASPHVNGYAWARKLRRDLGLTPDDAIVDLSRTIRERVGSFDQHRLPRRAGARVDGALAAQSGGIRLAATERSAVAERFLVGRALARLATAEDGMQARLLTAASGWHQRAGRAFSAEFLAPAAGIDALLGDKSQDDPIAAAAAHFQVSPLVIQHQIANHVLDYQDRL